MQYMNTHSDQESHEATIQPLTPTFPELARVEADEFVEAFGEPLRQTLDLDTWQPGENLAALYERLQAEIEDAVRQENRIRGQSRQELFPRLRTRPDAPANAGVWMASSRLATGRVLSTIPCRSPSPRLVCASFPTRAIKARG